MFFSNSDSLYTGQIEDLDFHDSKRIEEINFIINNMLPVIEKQVIYLLYFLKKNQETTGRLLNVSQEMVYYYKKRAILRIKTHYFFRSIDIQKMEEFLSEHVTKKQYVAMIEYFKVHDLRKITKIISELEGKKSELNYEAIGSRIKLGLKKINSLRESKDEELSKKAELYHKIFKTLKVYNSLHHTQSKKKTTQEIEA